MTPVSQTIRNTRMPGWFTVSQPGMVTPNVTCRVRHYFPILTALATAKMLFDSHYAVRLQAHHTIG